MAATVAGPRYYNEPCSPLPKNSTRALVVDLPPLQLAIRYSREAYRHEMKGELEPRYALARPAIRRVGAMFN
jgi:hypothetical protein